MVSLSILYKHWKTCCDLVCWTIWEIGTMYYPWWNSHTNNSYHASIGMAPYEALYGWRCRTSLCWYQDGEALVLGPEFLQQTTRKVKLIQDRMRATQSRQKSYADKKRRPLEFDEGDHVFLRVTPTTGVGRVLKSRKLTPGL